LSFDALAQSYALRHALFVSPGTASVSLSISENGSLLSTTVADVSSGSPNCITSGGSRTCTIPLNVGAGTYTFGLATFNQAPSGGAIPANAKQLGAATTTATIAPGQSNAIDFFVGAVISSVGIGSQGNTSSYTSLPADGNPHTYVITIVPTDASGNPVSGTNGALATPVSVTLGESGGNGNAVLVYNGLTSGANATLKSANDTLAVAYNGAGSAGYAATVTFNASGIPASTLVIAPLYVSSAQLAAGTVTFSSAPQSVTLLASEAGAPAAVSYAASGASCSSLPAGSNPQLPAVLSGNVAGSGPSGTVVVIDNVAPKSTSGCSVTVADNLGSSLTFPIAIPPGSALASSAVAGAQIDPNHYSSGAAAALSVTQGGVAVSSATVHEGSPSTLTVAEADDVAAPAVTSTTCNGIITVASSLTQGTWSSSAMGSLSGTITLIGTATGTCTVGIGDGNGQSQTVTLTAVAPGGVTEYGSLSNVTCTSGNCSLDVGPDNRVWVSFQSNDGGAPSSYVAAITTSSGAVAYYQPLGSGTAIYDVVNGGDGSLYALNGSGNTQISKIGPNGALIGTNTVNFNGSSMSSINQMVRGYATLLVRGGDSSGCFQDLATFTPSTWQAGLFVSLCGSGLLGSSGSFNLIGYGAAGGALLSGYSTYDGFCDQPNSPVLYGDYPGLQFNAGYWSSIIMNGACGAGQYWSLNFPSPASKNHWWFAQTGGAQIYDGTSASTVLTLTKSVYSAALDAGGNLWVGGLCGSNIPCFVKYDSALNPSLYSAPALHGAPTSMILAPDGNIWFVEQGMYFGKLST
jgi:hypothetical protein